MIELTGRKDIASGSARNPAERTARHTAALRAEQEIELICDIIKNGYHLGLSSHNQLSPRERFEFAVKLEEVCAIAEWMSRYVEHQEVLGRR